MTNTNTSPFASAPREIDSVNLDQVVGGASDGDDARKQEQADKLTAETEFRPGGRPGSR